MLAPRLCINDIYYTGYVVRPSKSWLHSPTALQTFDILALYKSVYIIIIIKQCKSVI